VRRAWITNARPITLGRSRRSGDATPPSGREIHEATRGIARSAACPHEKRKSSSKWTLARTQNDAAVRLPTTPIAMPVREPAEAKGSKEWMRLTVTKKSVARALRSDRWLRTRRTNRKASGTAASRCRTSRVVHMESD